MYDNRSSLSAFASTSALIRSRSRTFMIAVVGVQVHRYSQCCVEIFFFGLGNSIPIAKNLIVNM